MPKKKQKSPLVSVVMGSASDWETMRHCVARLDNFGVANEHQIVSARRTPARMAEIRALRPGIDKPAAHRQNPIACLER